MSENLSNSHPRKALPAGAAMSQQGHGQGGGLGGGEGVSSLALEPASPFSRPGRPAWSLLWH